MGKPYRFFQNVADEMTALAPDSILSRTLYQDDKVRIILFGFAAGQELSEHTSSKPAMLHFLSGEARLTLGGDEQKAGPGTLVHMAPQLPHSVYAETEVQMLLYLIG